MALQQLFDAALEVGGILGLYLEQQETRGLRLDRLDAPQHGDDEQGAEDGQQVEADAGGQPDGERGQHHAGVLVVLYLGAVPHQAGGTDDAERARQACADDQHDKGADDRQDDLRLDDRRIARPLAPAARPHRHQARQASCQGQAPGGFRQAEKLGIEVRCVVVYEIRRRLRRREFLSGRLRRGGRLLRRRCAWQPSRRQTRPAAHAGDADEGALSSCGGGLRAASSRG